jgi:hypothetical protein
LLCDFGVDDNVDDDDDDVASGKKQETAAMFEWPFAITLLTGFACYRLTG